LGWLRPGRRRRRQGAEHGHSWARRRSAPPARRLVGQRPSISDRFLGSRLPASENRGASSRTVGAAPSLLRRVEGLPSGAAAPALGAAGQALRAVRPRCDLRRPGHSASSPWPDRPGCKTPRADPSWPAIEASCRERRRGFGVGPARARRAARAKVGCATSPFRVRLHPPDPAPGPRLLAGGTHRRRARGCGEL